MAAFKQLVSHRTFRDVDLISAAAVATLSSASAAAAALAAAKRGGTGQGIEHAEI